MKFYSGFSLKNESHFFNPLIDFSEYTVCGFSYGAIKAFEHVKEQLACGKRVDRLQLFSPAFFQTTSKQFKNLQLRAYRKNEEIYLRQFINSCFSPYENGVVEYNHSTTIDELEELLYYIWDIEELELLLDKQVKIEVYLGGEDKIIDVTNADKFFKNVATVTYIKDANHFLQIN